MTVPNLIRHVLWEFLKEFSGSKNELSGSEILAAAAKIKELCTVARITKLCIPPLAGCIPPLTHPFL
jgi:hypothetical protein